MQETKLAREAVAVAVAATSKKKSSPLLLKLAMDLDPDEVFRDDDDDPDNPFFQVHTNTITLCMHFFFLLHFLTSLPFFSALFGQQERESTKELAVYLVDASPKMFTTTCLSVSFFFHSFCSYCWLLLSFSLCFNPPAEAYCDSVMAGQVIRILFIFL